MRHLIFLFGLFGSLHAQCDLELFSFNPETLQLEIVVHNSENCGGASDVYVDHLNIGITNGVDTLNTFSTNYPEFYFLNFGEQDFNGAWNSFAFTGDTLSFNLADNGNGIWMQGAWDSWGDIFVFCPQARILIWQINMSNAPLIFDPNWAPADVPIQEYPDTAASDNFLEFVSGCPCDSGLTEYVFLTDTILVEVSDTISVFLTDTVFVEVTDTLIVLVTETDTTYILEIDTIIEFVEVITVDTILEIEVIIDTIVEYVDVLVVDTLYLYVHDTTYIYITDTVSVTYVETIYTTIQLDCDTGDPCEDGFVDTECRVYIPNSVTPGNDGINDAWGAVTDIDCWFTWELSVYNRWGERLWVSDTPGDRWNMGITHYIQDGVYTWSLRASSYDAQVIDRQGHFTVIRE